MAQALRAWIDGDPAPALAMASGAPVAASSDTAETVAVPVVRPVPAASPQHGVARITPMAAVAGVLLLAVALAGIGLAVSGGLPALGEAGASATPSARVTPIPTPGWRVALLATYQEACGAPLDRSELQGLSHPEAEALVAEAIQDCQAEEPGEKGKGHGHGPGGRGGPKKD